MSKTIQWDDFVRAWLQYDSIAAVGKATGLSPRSVAVYATRLRKLGVKLPKKQRGRVARDVDVRSLNALIAKESR